MYGNAGGDWVSCIASQASADNNFSLDPRYCVDDGKELFLQDDSPCLASNSACGLTVGALELGCTSTEIKHDSHSENRPVRICQIQNYPNPFNSSTVILYDIDHGGFVRVDIFDIMGRLVTKLPEQYRGPGRYSVVWTGIAHNGVALPSGLYLCRLQVGGVAATTKILLLK